jgi:signal transduction histidine kinase
LKFSVRNLVGFALLMGLFISLLGENDGRYLETRLTGSTEKERIEILVELTEVYLKNVPQKALKYGLEALELLKSFPDKKQHIKILNLISNANSQLGKFQGAMDYAQKCLAMAQSYRDKNGEADALVSISRVYWDQGNYGQAAKSCLEAQKLYKEAGNKMGLANTLRMSGITFWRLGELPKALDLALKATELYEQLDDLRGKTALENLIARIYSTQGQYEKALEHSFKAKKGYEELDEKNGISICLNNIGNDYRRSGNYEEALKYLKQASAIFQEMKSKKAYSYTLNNIGDVYDALKDYPQAQEYFSRSLEIKEELKDQMGIAYTLISSARTYRKQEQYKKAIPLLLRALDIAIEINTKNEIRNAYKELSETFEELKDYPQALEYHKKYKDINDTIFNEENNRETTKLQTRFETEKKEKEIALLKKDKEQQQLNLLKQRNLINTLIILSLLVFLLALFTRHYIKMKGARVLQKEIEDRKKVETELLKSQKMEAVGILAGGIAHDFNNLLSIIIGNLALAEDDIYDNPQAAAQQLKAVEKACDQASELSQKLITISTGGGILSQKITLSEIFENMTDHYPEMKYLNYSFSTPPDLKPIYGDERQLRQVLYNLLKNAHQAMKKPEKLIIQAENITFTQNNNFSMQEGDYVKISIVDNGIGIPREELEKIFVPYFSTNTNVTQKGRGLGLALCYSIIKRHKGHIRIDSEVGKGTTVELYLPAYNKNSGLVFFE